MRESWMDLTVGKMKMHVDENATKDYSENDMTELKKMMNDWNRLAVAIEIAKTERPDMSETFDAFGLFLYDQYINPKDDSKLNDPITTQSLIDDINEWNNSDCYTSVDDYNHNDYVDAFVS